MENRLTQSDSNFLLLSFAAALIYSEVPAANQAAGQTKSFIEFTVKETNEKVLNDILSSFVLCNYLAEWAYVTVVGRIGFQV